MRTKQLQRRRLRFARAPGLAALCVLPAVLGCDDDDAGALPGEIGNNHFFYGCSTIDDAHCRDELTSFPDKIAVGGSFDLHAKDDNGSRLSARPASPVIVTSSGEEFRFRRAGFSAFLAFDFGEFVDFAHIEAVDVTDIEVLDSFGSSQTELVLKSGKRTTVTAVPLDELGDTLAGSLVYRWASEDEEIVAVEAVGTTVQVTALAEGTAQLRVSLGEELSRLITVVVEPGPVGGSDAGNDLDAGDADVVAPDAEAPDAAATASDAGDAGTSSGATGFDAGTDAGASATTDAGDVGTDITSAVTAPDGGS